MPLTTIRASVEVLVDALDPELPEPLRRLLPNVEHETQQLGTMTDDLLDLNRIQAVAVHTHSDDDRHVDHAMVVPHFEKRGIEPAEGVWLIKFARSKPLYLRVQRLAQPTDLALADAVHAQCLDQVVDAPGTHALNVQGTNYQLAVTRTRTILASILHGRRDPGSSGKTAPTPCAEPPCRERRHASSSKTM